MIDFPNARHAGQPSLARLAWCRGAPVLAAVSSGRPLIVSILKSLPETGMPIEPTRDWPKSS